MASVRQEPLPYSVTALAPHISSKTLQFHYGKHHKKYVATTNELIKGTSLEGASLEEILRKAAGKKEKKKLFNNAAQAWNHAFYWKSLRPRGGGKPGGEILERMKDSFGGFAEFKKEFLEKADKHFGSGWVWLIKKGRKLEIVDTHDADNPLVHKQQPLVTLDLWEHAYYLDYQNEKKKYYEAFVDRLANWGFAEDNLALSGRS